MASKFKSSSISVDPQGLRLLELFSKASKSKVRTSFTDCIDIGRGQAPNPPALKLAARRSQIGFPNITDPDQAMQDERADFFCSDAELR
ncbi:hypothetical protein PAXINDRAFT_103944 [Paxillus involutus ATCC 200175]|uniref:Uncharacterized protein n=1 Tax=Paxillus involutus ATCC 200175 TaxID=664439 RepID=A0A0C9T9V3_PAXIN|nr:hypothetical protein PAXINDRAFT_103944 [Paxillus involutus ATCC 200175]